LDCGGSTPPCLNAKDEDQGGVEPPQSKVLRTAIFFLVNSWRSILNLEQTDAQKSGKRIAVRSQ
jgi:hypothetical protein